LFDVRAPRIKAWRDGGPYPQISFDELDELIEGATSLSYRGLLPVWHGIIEAAQALDRTCSREGTLPPYFSFIEELLKLHDARIEPVYPSRLVFLAMRGAVPSNWEFMGMC
jgi:hypothetical protein